MRLIVQIILLNLMINFLVSAYGDIISAFSN
jgi:hypothetical protein